jgi:hypothetical protein
MIQVINRFLLLSYLLDAVIVDDGSGDARRSRATELTRQHAFAVDELILL